MSHLNGMQFLAAVSETDTAAVRRSVATAAAAGEAEALLSTTDRCGRQALHRAAACGHVGLTKLLLQAGAAPTTDEYGYSALFDAASSNSPEVVQLLLSAGADPNAVRVPRSGLRRAPELNTGTPLHLAAACASPQVLQLLLHAGAAVDAAGPDGATALLGAGAAVNACDRSRQTPLGAAAVSGSATSVRMLVAAGADVNAVNRLGRTALESAIYRGHVEAVSALLAAGAEAEPPGHSGPHPLQYVAQLAAERPSNSKSADVLATILQHSSRTPGWAAPELLVESAAAIAGWSHCEADRQAAVSRQLLLAAGAQSRAAAREGLRQHLPRRRAAHLLLLDVMVTAWAEASAKAARLDAAVGGLQAAVVSVAAVLSEQGQEQQQEGVEAVVEQLGA